MLTRWHELTWEQVRDKRPIAVLPAGSVEQHGPHLPTGTDFLIPIGLCDRLASRYGPGGWIEELAMLPPLCYTYARHSDWWPGTANVDGITLTAYVRDIAADLFRQGIRRLLVVNGHLESSSFIREGIEVGIRNTSGNVAVMVNWWELVSDAFIADLFGDAWPGWEAEHAALTETSLMAAMHPGLVRMDRAVDDRAPRHLPYLVWPQPAEVRAPTGVFASVGAASAEIGFRLADHILDGLAEVIRERFL